MRRVYVQGATYWRIERASIEKELPQLMPAGSPSSLTLHWTAGNYSTSYRAYQVLIAPDHILVSASLLSYFRHQHTWNRNSGNIGVSFMAMAGATERNAGLFPVTKDMVEIASLVVGMLQKKYGLSKSRLRDHAYWAKIDGYAGYRWDAQFILPWENQTLTEVVRRKGWWYRERVMT